MTFSLFLIFPLVLSPKCGDQSLEPCTAYRVSKSSQVILALLNSTVFACERYAAVKALGREAAIDVEVFTASSFRTPDLRRFSEGDVQRPANSDGTTRPTASGYAAGRRFD